MQQTPTLTSFKSRRILYFPFSGKGPGPVPCYVKPSAPSSVSSCSLYFNKHSCFCLSNCAETEIAAAENELLTRQETRAQQGPLQAACRGAAKPHSCPLLQHARLRIQLQAQTDSLRRDWAIKPYTGILQRATVSSTKSRVIPLFIADSW